MLAKLLALATILAKIITRVSKRSMIRTVSKKTNMFCRIILDIYEFSNVDKIMGCRPYAWWPSHEMQILVFFSHLLMILNSSVNFVVYCLVGHTFRYKFVIQEAVVVALVAFGWSKVMSCSKFHIKNFKIE